MVDGAQTPATPGTTAMTLWELWEVLDHSNLDIEATTLGAPSKMRLNTNREKTNTLH